MSEDTMSDAPESTEAPEVEEGAPAEETVETPEPATYELPDGNKATGEQLLETYKNLLSDYTKKSQVAAQVEAKQQPWDNPEWEAQTSAELLQAAEARALAKIEAKQAAAQQEQATRQQAINDFVAKEVQELKKLDPNVDENRVMAHAAKYNFQSLLTAHKNLKEFEQIEKMTEERVSKAMQKRSGVPVGGQSATATGEGIKPPAGMTLRETAQYALQQLNSQ